MSESSFSVDTSVRNRGARVLRPLAVTATALALALGGTAVASADDLKARQSGVQESIKDARSDVAESTDALEQASATYEAATKQLEEARSQLEATRAQLAEAKAKDAKLAENLAQQQEKLRVAREATAKAREAAEKQRSIVADAARDAYRNRSDLSGLAVVLESQSTAEFSQRLQWDTTIFSATNTQFLQLRGVEQELAEAERVQAEAEAKLAAEKKAAEESLAQTSELARKASENEAVVNGLTERAEKVRADAASALQADTERYNQLQAEDDRIQAELTKRANEALGAANVSPAAPATLGAKNTLGFIRPVNANPGSPFGQRFHPILKIWRMHRGTDFGAACGTPLYAARGGTVVSASAQGGFGNYVVIDHGVVGGASMMTGYAHMQNMSVRPGQQVGQGDNIGTVGTTGLSTGCHLHLQVYKNGGVVNPMSYIP